MKEDAIGWFFGLAFGSGFLTGLIAGVVWERALRRARVAWRYVVLAAAVALILFILFFVFTQDAEGVKEGFFEYMEACFIYAMYVFGAALAFGFAGLPFVLVGDFIGSKLKGIWR